MLLVCKIDSLIGQRAFWKLLHQFIISCRLIIMVKDNWKENCRHILLLGKTKELLWNNVLIICPPTPLFSGFDMLQGQAGGGYSMSPCSDDSFLFQAGGVDRCLNQIYSIYLDSWCKVSPQPHTEGVRNALRSSGQNAALIWSGPAYASLFMTSVIYNLILNSYENRPKWKLDWRQSRGQMAKHEAPKRKSGQILSEIATTFIFSEVQRVWDLDIMEYIHFCYHTNVTTTRCQRKETPHAVLHHQMNHFIFVHFTARG